VGVYVLYASELEGVYLLLTSKEVDVHIIVYQCSGPLKYKAQTELEIARMNNELLQHKN